MRPKFVFLAVSVICYTGSIKLSQINPAEMCFSAVHKTVKRIPHYNGNSKPVYVEQQ